MVTLKDIANELNVSIPLVSKVLNKSRGTTGVGAETADRIREAAARMGYRRNRSAAALRTGRHNILGILVHRCGTAGSGVIDEVLAGISSAAGKHGQQLELVFYETDEEFRHSLKQMSASTIDGLVVAGVAHRGIVEDLLDVQREGVPVVTVFAAPIHDDVPNVGCDEEAIGYLAARHLIDQGCRRIALLTGMEGRCDGALKALHAAGLPVEEQLQQRAYNPDAVEFGDGLEAVGRLLDSGVSFDGLFAPCDLHAMAAIRVLFRRGVKIPSEVRVVGVDNSPACAYGVLPLSSIGASIFDRAATAVTMLVAARDDKPITSTSVAPTLYARESTDAAAG